MLTALPINYGADVYGNAPPPSGGTCADNSYKFTYATPAGTSMFSLPPGATLTWLQLVVPTAFTGGTPVLSVGITGNATYYLNAGSVLGSAGIVTSITWITTNWFTKLPSGQTLTVTVGGSPTAGAGVITATYVMS